VLGDVRDLEIIEQERLNAYLDQIITEAEEKRSKLKEKLEGHDKKEK